MYRGGGATGHCRRIHVEVTKACIQSGKKQRLRLPKPMNNVTLRIDKETYNAIKTIADHNEQSVSEYVRQVLESGAERAASVVGREAVAAAVRAEMRRALRVTENRIVKILAKAVSASAANKYLSMQCIAASNRRDVTETLKLARTAAVDYLQQKDGEDGDGEK